MRITTINANTEDSDDDEKDNVMPKKRTTLYTQPTQDLKGINKTFPEEGGFDDEGGFIKYFPGNATRNETYAEYRKITNAKWFYNNMIRTAVELMFYNNNDEMGILIQIVFFKSNTGELTVSKRQFTYLPQNYDDLTRPMIILKLLIFIAFFIMMFTLFIKTLVIVISRIKQFFVRRTLDLHWYTYIDMVVVSLCISSATLWFILFIKTRETFKLPIQKEEDFNAWAVFASRMRLYIRISAMCVVLMSIRNLRVLTTQFPAFGVLFDTIRRAKIDLIYFFILNSQPDDVSNSLDSTTDQQPITQCPVFASLNKLPEEKKSEMLKMYDDMVKSGAHSAIQPPVVKQIPNDAVDFDSVCPFSNQTKNKDLSNAAQLHNQNLGGGESFLHS